MRPYTGTCVHCPLLEQAVRHYGRVPQIHMAIEEMAELTKELCKDLRGETDLEHIADEMADVQIMLDQLFIIYGNRRAVEEHRRYKLERLRCRMIRGE